MTREMIERLMAAGLSKQMASSATAIPKKSNGQNRIDSKPEEAGWTAKRKSSES